MHDFQPFSTTENTEAAFAGTEAIGEWDPKRLFNRNTTPPACERFELFANGKDFPMTAAVPANAASLPSVVKSPTVSKTFVALEKVKGRRI